MSNVISIRDDEPRTVAEWRRALEAAEQRCADTRAQANAQAERARKHAAAFGLLTIERDAAVKEARLADVQRRMSEQRMAAVQTQFPLAAVCLGAVLGAVAAATGIWAVLA